MTSTAVPLETSGAATGAASGAASGATGSPLAGLGSAGAVLGFVRECRREADRREALLVQAAVVWAEQHPAESLAPRACLPGSDIAVPLAGEGAPEVSEFCIAEFAAAVGMTTEAGRGYLGQALELAYRLPRVWARVVNLDLPAWRARRIAEHTMILTPEAAAFVDAQVAPFAHKVGPVLVDRLVEEAIGRFMPDLAREQAAARADGRRFDINERQVSFDGTVDVSGELDLADALDLEAAIAAGAEALKAAGSTESLPVRRARAAGELARTQLALALNPTDTDPDSDREGGVAGAAADAEGESGDGREPDLTVGTDWQRTHDWGPVVPAAGGTARGSARRPARVKPRRVVIYAHLSADALTGARRGGCTCRGCTCGTGADAETDRLQVARVENRRQLVTAEQVRSWCANPDTEIVVKPVIDVAEHVHVGAYEVPDRLAEQAQLRDLTCVFPHCTRPARGCDIDHAVAHAAGGPTATRNLAPLCRRHHRLKTHSAWTYTVLEPGSYLWSSPHGYSTCATTKAPATSPPTPAPAPTPTPAPTPAPASRHRDSCTAPTPPRNPTGGDTGMHWRHMRLGTAGQRRSRRGESRSSPDGVSAVPGQCAVRCLGTNPT